METEGLLADLKRGLTFVGARAVEARTAGGHELALGGDEIVPRGLHAEPAHRERADAVLLALLGTTLGDVVLEAAGDEEVRADLEAGLRRSVGAGRLEGERFAAFAARTLNRLR